MDFGGLSVFVAMLLDALGYPLSGLLMMAGFKFAIVASKKHEYIQGWIKI